MKKFRYSMENILEIKLKLEDQAKIAYSVARARLTTEEQQLENLRMQKADYEEKLRTLTNSKLNMLEIRQCGDAIEIIKYKIKIQIIQVKEAEKRLEVARVHLTNAMTERKTQEKLKEKAFETYMEEFEAEERKEADEKNSFQYSDLSLDEEDR